MSNGMGTPKGFLAVCRCGENVGAMDFIRTDRKEAGKLLSDWLMHGCTIIPQFESNWTCKITSCKCKINGSKE